ncbi:MAG: hypothetical protein II841_04810 [Bacteroidales bacterium]|nr:hypothetical protein [Bacteroidales bacterium]
MSDQINAVLTAKDVEGIRERLKKIQQAHPGDLRLGEHCRQISQTLGKGQRKVARAEKKAQQQTKSHATIMSEEIKTTEVPAQEPETFEGWLDAKLKGMADEDPVFAEKLANPDKSREECIRFIQGEVYEKYVKGKKHGDVAVGMPSRDYLFGLAVHYYDEEVLTIRKLPGNVRAAAGAPAPTKEELAKLKAEAEARALKQFEVEAREKLEAKEKARKKAEAEKKKAEREKKEAERKAAGEMSLFDLFGL